MQENKIITKIMTGSHDLNKWLEGGYEKDIITLFMALQRQNFALANTVSNLVKQWPNHLNTTETTGK